MVRTEEVRTMAYREVDMWEILEVLRRLHRQESKAAIKRATGRTRKTIRRYLAAARALGWDGMAEPTDALAVAIARQLKPVPETPRAGASEVLLAPHRTRIQQWLFPEDGGRGLRLAKVHTLLRREGVTVPYSSLHRFVVTQLGFQDRRRRTVRVAEVAPGELAEVDFGRLGLVPDPVTGKRRVVHALLITLVYSRHQYVYTTTSQQIPDLVAGLEDAWEYFGGVPARVVLDNLRAAIAKADRYDPIFARTFDEYARHRGFVIDAAVVRHATGKPHVERNVQYVRENFFRGETWLDAAHVHREAIRWCTETAGTRIHGTTRERPLVRFDTERAALQPLDRPRFDPPPWVQCKVHPDHHIQVDKAIYSIPTAYLHKSVWVRVDRKLVRAYFDGALIKTHARQHPGGRATDYDDYPEELAAYAMRDPDRMIREGRRLGPHVGRFLERLLVAPFPWAYLRQAQKLLRLGNKYGRTRLDGACQRALHFDLIHVGRVETILKKGLAPVPSSRAGGQLVLLRSTRFLRPAGSFDHPRKETASHGDQSVPQDGAQAPQALGHPSDASRSPRLRQEDEAQ
jgi:transposase